MCLKLKFCIPKLNQQSKELNFFNAINYQLDLSWKLIVCLKSV